MPAKSSASRNGSLSRDNPVRLEDFAGHLLRCASNIASATYYQVVGATDITPRQFAVLLSLKNHGPQSQRQLCDRTRIDSSTLNEMVPRMIRRGLVARRRSKTDRRAIELSLSEEGRQQLASLLSGTIESQELVLSVLPREYRKILMHCLQTIIEANKESILANKPVE